MSPRIIALSIECPALLSRVVAQATACQAVRLRDTLNVMQTYQGHKSIVLYFDQAQWDGHAQSDARQVARVLATGAAVLNLLGSWETIVLVSFVRFPIVTLLVHLDDDSLTLALAGHVKVSRGHYQAWQLVNGTYHRCSPRRLVARALDGQRQSARWLLHLVTFSFVVGMAIWAINSLSGHFLLV
jgi:hypothetical protein